MKSPTILVVDDDFAIRMSFARVLKEHGYDVDTATSAHEAIEHCKKGSYDLALLDIKLPDMEGTQLLKELNVMSGAMIKIMITGYSSLDSALRSLLLEANAYVIKPVDDDELLQVVAEALSTRQNTT
ncbi:MAG: response regulator [Halobacteriota archaeon]